jgi:hypothetical protein
MAIQSDRMLNSIHESFLLGVIALLAFALIAAANGAYTTDACHVGGQASDTASGRQSLKTQAQQQATTMERPMQPM